MSNLYIIGAGGLGRGLADALLDDNHINEKFETIYFVDDNNVGDFVNGILVKYNVNDFSNLKEKCLVINGIGSPSARIHVQNKLNMNPDFKFPNFIDSDVKLYKHVKIGQGNIISRGVVFSTNIDIGNFNLIHYNSTIGHDLTMGDFNCIYPLTALSGYTFLGNGNMIGTGSSSLPHTVLEDNINVGANSLLRGKYESVTTVVGTPAESIKK